MVNGSSDIIRIDAKLLLATERVGNGHHFNDATVGKFFLRSKAVNPQKLLEVFVKRHPFVGIFVAVETLILNGIIGVFRHLVLCLAFAAVSRDGKRLGGCLVFAIAVMAEGIVVVRTTGEAFTQPRRGILLVTCTRSFAELITVLGCTKAVFALVTALLLLPLVFCAFSINAFEPFADGVVEFPHGIDMDSVIVVHGFSLLLGLDFCVFTEMLSDILLRKSL